MWCLMKDFHIQLEAYSLYQRWEEMKASRRRWEMLFPIMTSALDKGIKIDNQQLPTHFNTPVFFSKAQRTVQFMVAVVGLTFLSMAESSISSLK